MCPDEPQPAEPAADEDEQRAGEGTDRPAHVSVEDDSDATSAAAPSTTPPLPSE